MEVRPGLFVGGWQELEEGRNRWTHVLSLDGVHSQSQKQTDREDGKWTPQRMNVNMLDLPSENILQHLTRCLGFISRALKSEEKSVGESIQTASTSVLVHCHAGCSRSVAIVAAYLMREERVNYEQALEIIKMVNPNAEPNEGFEEQLKLYEKMGCRIDVNNPLYRHHLLRQQTKQSFVRKPLPTKAKGDEEGGEEKEEEEDPVATEAQHNQDQANLASSEEEYLMLCRKCRSLLAVSSQVLDHNPPNAESTYTKSNKMSRKFRQSLQQGTGGVLCSSVYVEPLKWMVEVEEGKNEGKLSCYKCKSRVGHFSWSGIQCSCSAWVTPAFQLHKSKLDMVRSNN